MYSYLGIQAGTQSSKFSIEYFHRNEIKDTDVPVYQWMAPGLHLETKVFLEAKTPGP